MPEARLAREGPPVERQQAAHDERHAEDIHREFVEKVIPTVMEIVGTVVRDAEQRGADREHHEPAEKQPMEQTAERFFVHAFLRESVNQQPLEPDARVAFETARFAAPPIQKMAKHLPQEHADARGHERKKNPLHPRRDIPEDLAAGLGHEIG